MAALTLPDGSIREYEGSVTGAAVAADIGPGLAKAALAIIVDGEMLDLALEIEADASLEIVTAKSEGALELIRHDAAHVMAEAVKELYPDAQVTIGPAIDTGFYYDFSRGEAFVPDDLEKIEARMHEIVKRDEAITREVWDRKDAITFFKEQGEFYKAELIEGIDSDEPLGMYRQGDFIDLCRGPHLPSTGKLGHAFKLMSIAGAYWRGDSRKEMLQRIYGTAWINQKDLDAYLHQIEEAEKRDHRKLGREMNLFHLQEEAMGSVFWHPNGWTLYREVEAYVRRKLDKADYKEVKTPQLIDRKLWEASGHWEKFREHMFTTESDDDRVLALKPMNCPAHVQIFRQGIKSYRDLPLRMAEFGSCHRNEPHGALHGLLRVRQMTQDDAHIFCTEDQITSETKAFCDLLLEMYRELGFDEVVVKFADRPDVRSGADDVWDKAEAALRDATKAAGLDVVMAPGEGAFYGPKLEFHLKDAIGRSWQCGTLQVDFVLPERLDAEYVGEDGHRHRPVMLHRAILGTLERFIGILIEQYAGRMPLWLAPVQVVVATITEAADEAAIAAVKALKSQGLRAEIDLRNEKINYKVREHSNAKVPAMFVLGGREAEQGTVSVRRLGNKNQEVLALQEAVDRIKIEAAAPDA
jgi:threonyl-tRNA synthetase